MKRRQVIQRIREEAERRNLSFAVFELARHSAISVGSTTRTLGRHREIDDLTARKFFDQFAPEFGKGWWR